MWSDRTRRALGQTRRAISSAFALRRSFGGSGGLLHLCLLVLTVGCGTPIRFPPVDLKAPGWTVRRGEAVWRRERGGDGIAAEFLVATRADGRAFVQLNKDAFPLAAGQSSPSGWTMEFPLGNKKYSGRGEPPSRIILFQLPLVLANLQPSKNISWRRLNGEGWRLENLSSGESLDVFLDP